MRGDNSVSIRDLLNDLDNKSATIASDDTIIIIEAGKGLKEDVVA
jgi:hypothetical protein